MLISLKNIYVMQGHHFSMLQHETEKLRNDIEKMRNELRSAYGVTLCVFLSAFMWKCVCFIMVFLMQMQVWNWQSYCWAKAGLESWKGVSDYINMSYCLSLSKLLFQSHDFHYPCPFMAIEYRRIREELANQNAETNNLTNKLDRVRICSEIFIHLNQE